MDMPFEGIPTVPPPKDRDRLAFFAGGCRYLVTATPTETVAAVKNKLFQGGIARACPGEVDGPEDIELYYACVRMEESGARLEDYRVPAVSWLVVSVEATRNVARAAKGGRSPIFCPSASQTHQQAGLQDHDRAVHGHDEARPAAQEQRVLALGKKEDCNGGEREARDGDRRRS